VVKSVRQQNERHEKQDHKTGLCPHHNGGYIIMLTDSSVMQTGWSRLGQYFLRMSKPIKLQDEPSGKTGEELKAEGK
jgi:hypothetical protein